MHDKSRMPELQPDLETETVRAVERMTMRAAEGTLFGIMPVIAVKLIMACSVGGVVMMRPG
jgi:hypothetical protein